MKKILSLIIAICLIITCAVSVGFSASAQDNSDVVSTGKDYGLAESCKDGNILQCFNWTLAQIKEELPNIAEAGFTSVQTSPLQSHDGSYNWYWLYQPKGFTPGNELGSMDDLRDLCTEADKYGVKIIVDVVANHVAGSDNGNLANSVESVFKTNKSKYFHNLGSSNNAGDRYSTTQKNWGMPDLNSENEDIQNMVYNMVVQLKNAGVDGIRWDAAKHIGLPSEECGFWSKMAQIDMYQYGEILGKPADDATDAENKDLINEYDDYIKISDTLYSSAVMSAVRYGNTYKTAGTWSKSGVAPENIVYWAESHDSYANEPNYGGWTKTFDQNLIDRAYAILGARADSQALYLSRPFKSAHQSIQYGVKGSTHFTSNEVAAVNRFHNAMVGTAERFTTTSNCYVVWREGGAVIVSQKSQDVDVSVSNYNKMVPAGTYTDQVSGNTFTVTDTKITGHIGSTGIAVIYNAPKKQIMIGDTDLNDEIEIVDATCILRHVASIKELSADELIAADVDKNGSAEALDATFIQRYLAYMKSTDHIGQYTTG